MLRFSPSSLFLRMPLGDCSSAVVATAGSAMVHARRRAYLPGARARPAPTHALVPVTSLEPGCLPCSMWPSGCDAPGSFAAPRLGRRHRGRLEDSSTGRTAMLVVVCLRGKGLTLHTRASIAVCIYRCTDAPQTGFKGWRIGARARARAAAKEGFCDRTEVKIAVHCIFY